MGLDDYTDIELFSIAGMSKVYRAIDRTSKRVILKKFHPRGLSIYTGQDHIDYLTANFEKEALLLKKFNHPNIPGFLDYFHDLEDEGHAKLAGLDHVPYIAMELAPGKPISWLIKENRKFTEDETIWTAYETLNALNYMHQFIPSVIHCDIKPGSIMTDEGGKVTVIDFGAAEFRGSKTQRLSEKAGITPAHTPSYAPLELLQAKIRPQTDLYALGLTMISMLYGKNIRSITTATVPLKENTRRPDAQKPLTYLRSQIYNYLQATSERLIELMHSMTEEDIANRPCSAREVMSVLETI
jgi:serine/threonine protein kinase